MDRFDMQSGHYDEMDLAAIQSAGAQVNMDANESVYFARQLEYIKSRSYDVKFPELTALSNIPVSSEIPAGANAVTYHQYEGTGMAKIITDYSDDLPSTEEIGREFTGKVKSLGVSYKYSVQDIRAAQMAGMPLEQRRANNARRANDVVVNNIAYFGDPVHKLPGLFNNPNTTQYALSVVGGKTAFADKTPDQVILDMNGMVFAMVKLTNGIEIPDTFLMPPDVYGNIATRPRSANSDTTILDFFLKTNPYIKSIKPVVELYSGHPENKGKNKLFLYKNSSDKLTLEIPLPYEQLAPQVDNLAWKVPCHSRIAGVLMYYPLSTMMAEGC